MKFVILGSGTGSNAEALLRSWREGKLGRAEPVGILSDKENAPILRHGKQFDVPARFVDPGRFKTKLDEEGEARYIAAIRESGADLVVLAGFMRVLKSPFLSAFAGRIINLHPSLLPAFKGLNAIGQAFDYGVRITGCTVHFVTGDLDGGPIIDQMAVRIERNDSLSSLEARVHEAEHALLPRVVRELAEDHD